MNVGSSEKPKVNRLVMGELKGEHFASVLRYLKCDQYWSPDMQVSKHTAELC